MTDSDVAGLYRVELVFAITSVAGATAAGAANGDERTVACLATYYHLVGEHALATDGTVIKVMGDGVLLTFPVARAREAVAALRVIQEEGTGLWRQFDSRCRLQVKVGVGHLMVGPLGPAGGERPDVYGDPLNQLFKAPWDDFVVTRELATLFADA